MTTPEREKVLDDLERANRIIRECHRQADEAIAESRRTLAVQRVDLRRHECRVDLRRETD